MENIPQGFTSKLNLYDHLGYIFVGVIAILLFFIDLRHFFAISNLPEIKLDNILVWLIASYFVGHIIQALSNILIREDKTDFDESEKKVLNKAKDYFNIENGDDHAAYLLCYMLACAKDITGHVVSFNAYYSLYRGWYTIFLLQSILLLFINIANWFILLYAVYFFISSFIAFLFYRRAQRFFKYSRSKTLQTFIILERIYK